MTARARRTAKPGPSAWLEICEFILGLGYPATRQAVPSSSRTGDVAGDALDEVVATWGFLPDQLRVVRALHEACATSWWAIGGARRVLVGVPELRG
jgi:hypothetical protein